jgi:Spy/CpxP family protein refolding chaperone
MRRQLTGKLGLPLVLGVVLMLAPGLVFAQPHGRHRGGHRDRPGQHHEMMLDLLDLNKNQEKSMQELMESRHEMHQQMLEEIHAARKAVRELTWAETIDEGAIRDASAAVADLEADLAVDQANTHQQIRSILTSEQLEKFMEMTERHRRHMGAGWGGHGWPHDKDGWQEED